MSEIREYTVYSATELREAFPEGFERAVSEHEMFVWEQYFQSIMEYAYEDFQEMCRTLGIEVHQQRVNGVGGTARYVPMPEHYTFEHFGRCDVAWGAQIVDGAQFLAACNDRGIIAQYAPDYAQVFQPIRREFRDRRRRIARAITDGSIGIRFVYNDDYYHQLGVMVCEIEDNRDLHPALAALLDDPVSSGDLEHDLLDSWGSLLALLVTNIMREYEYQIEPERFIDAADANEWMFRQDGAMD